VADPDAEDPESRPCSTGWAGSSTCCSANTIRSLQDGDYSEILNAIQKTSKTNGFGSFNQHFLPDFATKQKLMM
jgi:hypothetical protein